MILVSDIFNKWLAGLKDQQGKFAIIARIRRAELGNFGDCNALGNGLFEMRVHSGPGYRIYYAKEADTIYFLFCGGDKSSQKQDIICARQMLMARKQAQ